MRARRTIRPAAVAGRFYPRSADELRQALDQLLDAAIPSSEKQSPHVRAIIGPHAGYIFSGPVAASAYRQLRQTEQSFRRVVLFGPAHYEPFDGLAVSSAEAFACPLGEVAVDREAVDRLLDLPCVTVNDVAHAPEHGLEVHLPFLIDALGGAERFQIVPLLFADADDEQALAALEAVGIDEQTLIVASSDLSHYMDHAAATAADRATADAIIDGDRQVIGPYQACGHIAVRGLMRLAERLQLSCCCIDLRNSADTAPQFSGHDRVVGYGAFVFTG
ncbi:MAG: AmmeMemoRadiSam system protein B [Phycisphaeraceae bacterium]|nr:AmmeMemoRadiSam system protein B [Phycisphaeraceae bacterium]